VVVIVGDLHRASSGASLLLSKVWFTPQTRKLSGGEVVIEYGVVSPLRTDFELGSSGFEYVGNSSTRAMRIRKLHLRKSGFQIL